ncbi:hypothetical protein [Actinokineospora sp. NBRC 105648]|uniref:hypothetical protein n=1 Tax=Actinokineospora sp. NBRC 105648 TaxID=3032206 RepID=UPI0024A3473D|nr:hypothetical protein [Actinokineospora sp. NBRC 105648]GLZ40693.1 hypothetical protein Acsp05_43170 [Actinokineospora sp. NBRC 105648]
MKGPLAPRSTGRSLLLLRNALVVLTALTLLLSWLAFRSVEAETTAVATTTAPALLGIANARTALAEAERSVTETFASDRSSLTGPGEQYQNQIALANQALTEVSADNAAGERGSTLLLSIQGLLIDYIGLIEQADAQQDRAAGTVPPLATANLWYASGLMDDVQSRLEALARLQQERLDEQIRPKPVVDLAPLVLAVALVVVLVLGQRVLRVRFRRRVNPALVGATALAVLVLFTGLLSLLARFDLRAAAATLRGAAADHTAVVEDTSARGDRLLRDFLDHQCADTRCGTSVDRFRTTVRDPGREPDTVAAAARSKAATSEIADASAGGWLPVLPIAAGLVIGLVVLGFHPRLAEYRYERR